MNEEIQERFKGIENKQRAKLIIADKCEVEYRTVLYWFQFPFRIPERHLSKTKEVIDKLLALELKHKQQVNQI